jgi:hypothetical protein
MLESDEPSKKRRKSWARLIQRIYKNLAPCGRAQADRVKKDGQMNAFPSSIRFACKINDYHILRPVYP